MIGTWVCAVGIMVHRNAAWAIAIAATVVAVLSLIGVILAWRAVRKTRRALRILEELRRTPQPHTPSPGPRTRQVPVMVTPETVFPSPVQVQPPAPQPPAEPPDVTPADESPEAEVLPPEERAPSRFQRPPPDIARYEVRFPSHRRERPPIANREPVQVPTNAETAETTETAPETVPPATPEPEEPLVPELDETGVLLRALQSADPFVRTRAVEALGGRPEGERGVIDALEDDYPIVRRSAVRALRHARGSRAAQALVDVVSHDPSAEVREEAVGVLAEMLQHGAGENI